ncbi:MAG: dihydrodipicolinate reductase [Acidobacteria bacterium]|nr:dihydrodipicolinate reductase [Acidobacteriota bacterium]
MNIALIGYGKMGRMIEQAALARGHAVGFKADIAGNEQGQLLTRENLAGIDVAIDFTIPEAVVRNVDKLSALGISMVVGTTGWWDHLPQVRAMVEARNTGLVYGSNFSIGVNLFFRLMEQAAAMMAGQPMYDPFIHEIHHNQKLDAPSGTALQLEKILGTRYGKRKISVASNRAGAVPGEHTVGFDSEADTLTFTHTARSRAGFAAGAVHAAEWIATHKGLHEFADTLTD